MLFAANATLWLRPATLPKGEEKQLESGRNGYTVSTYRIYKDNNGNELKKF